MFYKLDGELLLSSIFVSSPSFDLIAENHNKYNYPVDGWYWFDTEEEAKIFFNINE